MPCDCENSKFSDIHHKHIITGDLRIIGNPKLRKLFSKGPKYHEPVPIDWTDALRSIEVGIENLFRKLV